MKMTDDEREGLRLMLKYQPRHPMGLSNECLRKMRLAEEWMIRQLKTPARMK